MMLSKEKIGCCYLTQDGIMRLETFETDTNKVTGDSLFPARLCNIKKPTNWERYDVNGRHYGDQTLAKELTKDEYPELYL